MPFCKEKNNSFYRDENNDISIVIRNYSSQIILYRVIGKDHESVTLPYMNHIHELLWAVEFNV